MIDDDYDRLVDEHYPPYVEVVLVARTADGREVRAAVIPNASVTWERANLLDDVPDGPIRRREIVGSATQFRITTTGELTWHHADALRPPPQIEERPARIEENR